MHICTFNVLGMEMAPIRWNGSYASLPTISYNDQRNKIRFCNWLCLHVCFSLGFYPVIAPVLLLVVSLMCPHHSQLFPFLPWLVCLFIPLCFCFTSQSIVLVFCCLYSTEPLFFVHGSLFIDPDLVPVFHVSCFCLV